MSHRRRRQRRCFGELANGECSRSFVVKICKVNTGLARSCNITGVHRQPAAEFFHQSRGCPNRPSPALNPCRACAYSCKSQTRAVHHACWKHSCVDEWVPMSQASGGGSEHYLPRRRSRSGWKRGELTGENWLAQMCTASRIAAWCCDVETSKFSSFHAMRQRMSRTCATFAIATWKGAVRSNSGDVETVQAGAQRDESAVVGFRSRS